MNNCSAKDTVTFNEDGWGNGMTYKKYSNYEYEIVNEKYKVYLGKGYLFFDESDFFEHFETMK